MIESFCPRGGIVLDPFAGYGSTCLAARMVGRHYVGIEIEPSFHEAASRRLDEFMSRLTTLEESEHLLEVQKQRSRMKQAEQLGAHSERTMAELTGA